ncbi:hypothetical protein PG984_015734 [Apiospora sp. TS-2023a]
MRLPSLRDQSATTRAASTGETTVSMHVGKQVVQCTVQDIARDSSHDFDIVEWYDLDEIPHSAQGSNPTRVPMVVESPRRDECFRCRRGRRRLRRKPGPCPRAYCQYGSCDRMTLR